MDKNIKKLIDYWVSSAEHDWETAETLWRGKRYDACLFFCHLIAEKILKAAVVKQTEDNPPKIHDLVKLARLGQILLSTRQEQMLSEMNEFNVAGRYSVEKYAFHKRATKIYSEPFYRFTKEFYLWVKKNQL